jgi:hypothetical protein
LNRGNVLTDAHGTFARCEELKTIVIPDSVATLSFASENGVQDTFLYSRKLDLATQAALKKRGWNGNLEI